MGDPALVVQKILNEPGMELLKINIVESLSLAVQKILAGYYLENKRMV
jgi:hypothetical protein